MFSFFSRIKTHLNIDSIKKFLRDHINLVIITIIVLFGILIITIGLLIYSAKTNNKGEVQGAKDMKVIPTNLPPNPTDTPTASPSATVTPPAQTPTPPVPTIDCIGPDGKHSFKTQKDCDDFNNAWKPTVTPTSTPPPIQTSTLTPTPSPTQEPTLTVTSTPTSTPLPSSTETPTPTP